MWLGSSTVCDPFDIHPLLEDSFPHYKGERLFGLKERVILETHKNSLAELCPSPSWEGLGALDQVPCHPPLHPKSFISPQVINVTGISIGSGLASACDTLMSQSANRSRWAPFLQRGSSSLLLCCFPCWALFINTERILLLIRQDPEVSRLTQVYVMIFIPALPFLLAFQAIILPQVLTGIAANLVEGSAWANTVSQYTQAILLFLYVWRKKIHVETWGGWTKDCLLDWGSFIWLAVPSMLMLCIEWWTFEIGSFLAGLLSVVELGAQSVIYELSSAAYMVPLGFSVAASVRVGNALGSGDVVQGQDLLTVLWVPLFTGPCHTPVVVPSRAHATCGGVLRGTGKQKLGAIANAIGYYAVGLPIGISLMFAAKMGVIGLWVGMIICISLQALSFSTFVIIRLECPDFAAQASLQHSPFCYTDHISIDTDAVDTVVLPQSIIEGERQPEHQLITQEEPAAVPAPPEVVWRAVIIRRMLAAAVAVAVLLVGILVRLLTSNA
uniref:Multidrug and toxin extrusion protein n=1 Tax=Strigops habroptila TaxID=2489341 RepID=A0A672UNH4_STRHB